MTQLPIITGAEWMRQGDNEPPAIIDRVLPSAALAFVAGEPGVGKTWLLWDLAFSVLSGRPFVGKYPVTTPGRVLFVATEGARRSSQGRAWAIASGKGLAAEDAIAQLHVLWRPPTFNLTNAADVAELVSHVGEHAIKLVIIDTLHGAWGGEENSSSEWGKVMQIGIRPLLAAGATVVLVHHNGKQGDSSAGRRSGQRMRGSSAMHGSRDVLLSLAPVSGDDSRVRVELELRDDAPVRPFTFNTPSSHVGRGDSFTLDWQPAETVAGPAAPVDRKARAIGIVRAAPGELTKDKLAREVGGRKETTLQLIESLIEAGQIVAMFPGPRLYPADAGNADGNAGGTTGNDGRNGTVPSGERSPVPTPPVGGERGNAPTAAAHRIAPVAVEVY